MNRDINNRSWLSQDELQERISKYTEEQRFWDMIRVLPEENKIEKHQHNRAKFDRRKSFDIFPDEWHPTEYVNGVFGQYLIRY